MSEEEQSLSVVSEKSQQTDHALMTRKLKYQARLAQMNNKTLDMSSKGRSFVFHKSRKSLDLSNSLLGMQILSNNQSMQVSRLSESIPTVTHINVSLLDQTHEISQASSNKTDLLQNKLNQKINTMKHTRKEEGHKRLIKLNLEQFAMAMDSPPKAKKKEKETKKEKEKEKEKEIKIDTDREMNKKKAVKKYTPRLTYQENNSSFLFNRKSLHKFTSLSPKFQNRGSSAIEEIHDETVKECEEYRGLKKKMDCMVLQEKKEMKAALKREMDQEPAIEKEEIEKETRFRQQQREQQSLDKNRQVQQNREKYQRIKATKEELSDYRYTVEQSNTYGIKRKKEANWQLSLIKQEKEKLKRKISMLTRK